MGVPSSDTASSTTSTRLKREDFRRTKHDSAFSQWKILGESRSVPSHKRPTLEQVRVVFALLGFFKGFASLYV
ncbi:hypothetical protein OROMI_018897 [Orobanche minor]